MDVSASSSSTGAIQQAFIAHSARAERLSKAMIAETTVSDDDFVKDMAKLPGDPRNVGIQTKVLKAKDDMLGGLIDILA